MSAPDSKPVLAPSPVAATADPQAASQFSDIARRELPPPGKGGNVDAAETAASASPDDPEMLRNLGLAYYAAAGYLPAARTLEKAALKLPGDGPALLYLGFALLGNGEIRTAISALDASIKAKGLTAKQKAAAYAEIGTAHYQVLRDDTKAADAFAAALKLDPNQGIALIGAGTLAAQRKDAAKAKALFSRAASSLPEGTARASAYACLARVAEGAHDPKEALRYAQKALADDPQNAWAKHAIARLKTPAPKSPTPKSPPSASPTP